ncbi:hypothetical protein V8E52_006414 [Russula decolorans]
MHHMLSPARVSAIVGFGSRPLQWNALTDDNHGSAYSSPPNQLCNSTYRALACISAWRLARADDKTLSKYQEIFTHFVDRILLCIQRLGKEADRLGVMKNPSTPPSEPRWMMDPLTTYVCESQMKRKMIKEAQDAGEAGEKKQGRKACFPFQVVRPSPRATWKTRRVWSLRTWLKICRAVTGAAPPPYLEKKMLGVPVSDPRTSSNQPTLALQYAETFCRVLLPTGVESSAGTACRQVVPSSFRKGLQCGSDRMSAPFQKFKDDRVRKRSSLLESKVTMTDSGGKNVATAHARWQQKPQHTYRLLARKSYHVKMVAAAG